MCSAMPQCQIWHHRICCTTRFGAAESDTGHHCVHVRLHYNLMTTLNVYQKVVVEPQCQMRLLQICCTTRFGSTESDNGHHCMHIWLHYNLMSDSAVPNLTLRHRWAYEAALLPCNTHLKLVFDCSGALYACSYAQCQIRQCRIWQYSRFGGAESDTEASLGI